MSLSLRGQWPSLLPRTASRRKSLEERTEMTNEQNEFLDRCASAFSVFQARFPDYENYNSEATASRMAAELFAANLSADNADHLGLVWASIRPTAPVPVVTEPVAED